MDICGRKTSFRITDILSERAHKTIDAKLPSPSDRLHPSPPSPERRSDSPAYSSGSSSPEFQRLPYRHSFPRLPVNIPVNPNISLLTTSHRVSETAAAATAHHHTDMVMQAQRQLYEQQKYYAMLLQAEAWNWKHAIEQRHHQHAAGALDLHIHQRKPSRCHSLPKYSHPASVRDFPTARPYPVIPHYDKDSEALLLDKSGQKYRRNRTVYTESQLRGFERKFDADKYLTNSDRQELAREYGVTQVQVKTWFQNRRMKWKKEVMQDKNAECPTKPKGRPKKTTNSPLEPLIKIKEESNSLISLDVESPRSLV